MFRRETREKWSESNNSFGVRGGKGVLSGAETRGGGGEDPQDPGPRAQRGSRAWRPAAVAMQHDSGQAILGSQVSLRKA